MAKLLVYGLGNPSELYKNTRHNLGHWFVDELASSQSKELKIENGFFQSVLSLGQHQLILAKSTNYMNQNGKGLCNLLVNHGCRSDNFLVVHDELDLPLGRVKLSIGKNCGGHNGVKNVLGSLKFSPLRLRLGIGVGQSAHSRLTDFVLSVLSASEKSCFKDLFPKLIFCIRLLLDHGQDRSMNYINRYPILEPILP